jgi:hypothetical protein
MDTVFELNGAFPPRGGHHTDEQGMPFIPIPTTGRSRRTVSPVRQRQELSDVAVTEVGAAVQPAGSISSTHPKAWAETLGFFLALMAVTGLAGLAVGR